MKNENELPIRKRNRLKNYDYSSCGAYFITVCTKDRKNILSTIVGEGYPLPKTIVKLSLYGQITENALKDIPKHYPHIELLQYVIMPNHIHLVLRVMNEDGRGNPSPTVSSVIGWLKYRITGEINKNTPGEKIFQRSFHDHVIRNHDDYLEICKYICENPIRWRFDKLYNE